MLQRIPETLSVPCVQHELDILGFGGCYDALYVPMKRSGNRNLRYAFVNFASPADAARQMGARSLGILRSGASSSNAAVSLSFPPLPLPFARFPCLRPPFRLCLYVGLPMPLPVLSSRPMSLRSLPSCRLSRRVCHLAPLSLIFVELPRPPPPRLSFLSLVRREHRDASCTHPGESTSVDSAAGPGRECLVEERRLERRGPRCCSTLVQALAQDGPHEENHERGMAWRRRPRPGSRLHRATTELRVLRCLAHRGARGVETSIGRSVAPPNCREIQAAKLAM